MYILCAVCWMLVLLFYKKKIYSALGQVLDLLIKNSEIYVFNSSGKIVLLCINLSIKNIYRILTNEHFRKP